VLLIGFVLLVSLVVSAGIAALDEYGRHGPDWLQPVMAGIHLAASLGIETLLFASIFKVLPSVSLRWSDVWLGGFVTALLFEVGKMTIGLYLGNAGVASAYGAAGSLAVLLVWVYYSSQILFLGAEFTQAWTQRATARAASTTSWADGWRGSDAQRS
jgi:membrane protein